MERPAPRHPDLTLDLAGGLYGQDLLEEGAGSVLAVSTAAAGTHASAVSCWRVGGGGAPTSAWRAAGALAASAAVRGGL